LNLPEEAQYDTEQPVNIEINFTQAAFSCLFDKVPADSPLRRVFEQLPDKDGVGIVQFIPGGTGMPLGPDVVMHCSEEQAKQLLEIAKTHCKDAVYSIVGSALIICFHSFHTDMKH
jgi:hypothetical protein